MNHYVMETGDDPHQESRRDVARLAGAALAAGPLLVAAITAVTHFGRSDVEDPAGWVHLAGGYLLYGTPAIAAIASTLAIWRRTRPFGVGMLAGTVVAATGTVVVFWIGN